MPTENLNTVSVACQVKCAVTSMGIHLVVREQVIGCSKMRLCFFT